MPHEPNAERDFRGDHRGEEEERGTNRHSLDRASGHARDEGAKGKTDEADSLGDRGAADAAHNRVRPRIRDILADDDGELGVDAVRNAIKLGDERVLNPINHDLARVHDGPRREQAPIPRRGVHNHDEQEDGELEALDAVCARDLEDVLYLVALEDGALELDEVVCDEEGDERVVARESRFFY